MIDTEEITCRLCGEPIPQKAGGHRAAVYCSPAHKMKFLRRQKMKSTPLEQNIAALQERLSSAGTRIAKLESQVQVQRSRVGELTEENRTLRTQLEQAADVEEAFSTDTDIHSFKKWLKAHQYYAERPGCKKILDDAYGFPLAGPRGTYTDAMRKAYFSLDDKSDVWDAWRAMLKEEMFKVYYVNREQKAMPQA